MPTADAPQVGRVISSDSVPAGGFTPGTILAERYRIIGLLGRGGMGEVYRADDLKLGQPVALKFLPPKLADDPVRRERFFAEVRITRQLSHPNICRVYDIGEIDGRHFLSMEYIDGEDLASLIKRIGHLTNEKALDITRQLAAGLAAAHERGVLHRDLKPANIMLDGHGRVRITDFGLAIAAEDEEQAAEIAGTPAYMAPEQLAGKGATVRSDMYSLGLVLYEIYTGKKAFTATNLAELREQKETHTPRAPSEIRHGVDSEVERLIQRCMERDPNARPSSVAQLALALPGGDPIAAALAAGETPSPEMVAASGSKEGLRPAIAWGLLAFIIVGTLANLAMNDRIFLHRSMPFEKRPEILAEQSREILKKAGYAEKPADSAYGFIENTDLLKDIESSDKTANRWKNLDAQAILFWYRQSPRSLKTATRSRGPDESSNLTPENFPLQFPGDVLITLDTEGCLISLRVIPSQARSSIKAAPAPDWKALFEEAGLDLSKWIETAPQWNPPYYADTIAAWQGSLPNRPNAPIRIEAAALQGKPVSFEIIGPRPPTAQRESFQQRLLVSAMTWVLIFAILFVGGIFFAHRNLRFGRGDRRSATRLALFVLGLMLIQFVLRMPHVSEIDLALCPLAAGFIWILYIALEPFVRRRWPQILVSWTRLLSGEWRDPLVARDAFLGCAFAILLQGISLGAVYFVPSWLGFAELSRPKLIGFDTVLGSRYFISQFLGEIVGSLLACLGPVFTLYILRVLLRSQTAAIAGCILLSALATGSGNPWIFAIALVVNSVFFIIVLMRYGLVTMLFSLLTVGIFTDFPTTLDSSAWYSDYGYAALTVFAAIVLYAFRTSLGGRPFLAPSRLDD